MQRKLNTSFFDQYSASFSEKISEDAFKGKQSITGKDILSVTPSKQVNFFILKILFTRWQEEMKRLESPYFNFKDAGVRKAMVAFMNTLSQKISMERSHFEPLVKMAVGDTLMMLADPAGYLAIDFSDKEPDDDLTEKASKTFLKYVKLHKYHYEQLLDKYMGSTLEMLLAKADVYFSEADLQEATQNECVVLSEVEKVTFTDLFEDDLDDFDDDDDAEEESIEDGFANEAVFAMDAELELEEAPEPEVQEAEEDGVIDETPEPKEIQEEEVHDEKTDEIERISEASEQQEEEAEDDYEYEDEDEDEDEDAYVSMDEAEDESSSWEVIVREPAKEEPVTPSVVEEKEEEAAKQEAEKKEAQQEKEQQQLNEKLAAPRRTINDRFEEEKVSLADHHQQAKVNNVMEAISVNNRYMFTQELFNGDKEEFQKAIARVEICESFDAAVELLVQDYSKLYHWDMNSDEVKELLKVVFRKFR